MKRDPVTILMVNAADAITEAASDGTQRNGRIRISTRRDDEHVIIEAAGKASGNHHEFRQQVFDPFFTTRTSGKAAGRGQAVRRSASARQQHRGRGRGRIALAGSVGVGTILTKSVPVSQPASAEKSASA